MEKRTLFNSFCSNVAKQVALVCCPFHYSIKHSEGTVDGSTPFVTMLFPFEVIVDMHPEQVVEPTRYRGFPTTDLLGGKKYALGLSRIQGKIGILRLWSMLGETTVQISHPCAGI